MSRPVTVSLVLPAPLRELSGGRARIALELDAAPPTVRGALAALRSSHPALHDRLLTEQGELRAHVNLFVGKEHIERLGGFDTPLEADAEVIVLPAVSGG